MLRPAHNVSDPSVRDTDRYTAWSHNAPLAQGAEGDSQRLNPHVDR